MSIFNRPTEPPITEGLSKNFTEMHVSQQQLADERVPLYARDWCAPWNLELIRCRRKNGYLLKSKRECAHQKHEVERCYYYWNKERKQIKTKLLQLKQEQEQERIQQQKQLKDKK